jgi:tetratricopeptide (TPR) repeat protein
MSNAQITDTRGLVISAPSADVVERFEAIVHDLYYYRLGVIDRLDELLAEAPDLVLGHVLMGCALLTEGSVTAEPKARDHLERAEALPSNRREQLHAAALRGWLDRDATARMSAWEQILVEWPLDLLALRQHAATLFWTGDKRHQAELVMSVAGQWGSQTPGYGHFLSAFAFSMEEVGHYAVAERAARNAIAIEPQDLWALHALAHVFEMQSRIDEGIELLEDAAQFLNDYNLFRGHLWWHLSLYRHARGEFDAALELFDAEIFPKSSTFYLDIQNAAALLVRLEFQGVDVGAARWERIAEAAAESATTCTLWFTAMHDVIALIKTDRQAEAQATLDYLHSEGAASAQPALAYELSQAAAAFYAGRPGEALEAMLALRQRHGGLGASHAQQDLYDQIMVIAALKLGDWPRVRELLKARLATRIWDEPSWQAFERGSSRVDALKNEAGVRAALRWALA